MQNNVTDLTQKLLRSVDSNYNVIDMPVVMEVITILERMHITKELLEATRLGKHINELRRKATTESLQKRSKELVKRWRRLLFPSSNGTLPGTPAARSSEDVNLNQVRKRPAGDKPESGNLKRTRVNGTSELDFSDNSNSSFKECIKSDSSERVLLINSDSNSSFHDAKLDPLLDLQQNKKRGRKKGSKNHRTLLDEAETSFTNKMAVSRGNAKVKTTQELVASLQNRGSAPSTPSSTSSSSTIRPLDNLSERAAKLTERVSIIDQKLNTNANRKNAQKKLVTKSSLVETKNDRVIESGIVVNITKSSPLEDEDIIVVDDGDQEPTPKAEPNPSTEEVKQEAVSEELPKSYSIEEALSLLPPIDTSCLEEEVEEETPTCTCTLKEKKSMFSLDDEDEEDDSETHFIEDCNCEARRFLANRYHLNEADEAHAKALNECYLPGINGHFGLGVDDREPVLTEDGLYENIVPNFARERLAKQCEASDFLGENYKRYSISDEKCAAGDSEPPQQTFREFHEVLDRPSYNDETIRILPYVIID